MPLLLRLAKHQHTIQLMVSAVLLRLVAQCYPTMIRLLLKKNVVSDVLFSRPYF
jgi:hypothetical protein